MACLLLGRKAFELLVAVLVAALLLLVAKGELYLSNKLCVVFHGKTLPLQMYNMNNSSTHQPIIEVELAHGGYCKQADDGFRSRKKNCLGEKI